MVCWITELWLSEKFGKATMYGTKGEFEGGFFLPSYPSLNQKLIKMEIQDYQDIIEQTAIYPKEFGLGYVTLGLNGEFQEFIKAETLKDRTKEFGDVCWYLTASCQEALLNLEEIWPSDYKTTYEDSPFSVEGIHIKVANYIIGQIQEIVKKCYRDKTDVPVKKLQAQYSLLVIHLFEIAKLRGIDIEEALTINYHKLLTRKEKGMIGGSGSDREEA